VEQCPISSLKKVTKAQKKDRQKMAFAKTNQDYKDKALGYAITQTLSDMSEGIKREGRLIWDSGFLKEAGLPVNWEGKNYKGVNIPILTFRTISKGYKSNTWIGAGKAKELGAEVKQGEQSTQGVNMTWMPSKCWHKGSCDCRIKVTTYKGKTSKIRVDQKGEPIFQQKISTFNVFNSAQLDWTNAKKGPICFSGKKRKFVPNDEADRIISGYLNWSGVTLKEIPLAESPHYSPSNDYVAIPLRSQYKTDGKYYGTIFHELGHSTQKEGRVYRKFDYTQNHERGLEEATVEIASAILQAYTGVDKEIRDNSVAYVQGWCEAFQKDPNMILTAMEKGAKVAQHLMEKGGEN